MAGFTKVFFNSQFACGMASYLDSHPMRGENRIVLTVQVEGFITEALMDTGSPISIFNPQLADLLEVAKQVSYTPNIKFRTSMGPIDGKIIPVSINIPADEGEGLTFDSMALIPLSDWHQPNFIGMQYFLDRLRFAIDPLDRAFYFGLA